MSIPREFAYQLGLEAERRAGLFLQARGYLLLQGRFKVRQGEIDLIVRKGDLLAFVEVKARHTLEEALEAVNWKNRRRLVAASEIWVQRHPECENCDRRFDIIAILPNGGPNGGIEHLEDAFRPWD